MHLPCLVVELAAAESGSDIVGCDRRLARSYQVARHLQPGQQLAAIASGEQHQQLRLLDGDPVKGAVAAKGTRQKQLERRPVERLEGKNRRA